MIEFIAAMYNEEYELPDLINHVRDYVDVVNIVDDGSTDKTVQILKEFQRYATDIDLNYRTIPHTGLPETVKHEALQLVTDGSWVLMLDADERFAPGVLDAIKYFVENDQEDGVSHVYFRQIEIIDGVAVREFQKVKLFKKFAVHFPLNNIHMDDRFDGPGIFKDDWIVFHRKTTSKQIQRETEYLQTYKKLRLEGHIDEGRERWLQNLHHYVKPKG